MRGIAKLFLAGVALASTVPAIAGRPIGHPPAPQRHALYFRDAAPEANELSQLSGDWGNAEVRGRMLRVPGERPYRLFVHKDSIYGIARVSEKASRLAEGRPARTDEREPCHRIVRVALADDGSLVGYRVAGQPSDGQCSMAFLNRKSRSERAGLTLAEGDAPEMIGPFRRAN